MAILVPLQKARNLARLSQIVEAMRRALAWVSLIGDTFPSICPVPRLSRSNSLSKVGRACFQPLEVFKNLERSLHSRDTFSYLVNVLLFHMSDQKRRLQEVVNAFRQQAHDASARGIDSHGVVTHDQNPAGLRRPLRRPVPFHAHNA